MALMSGFLSGDVATVYGTVCRMIYPVPGIMTPGREQASRHVASTFVDSENG
jgi:hypothetical protein